MPTRCSVSIAEESLNEDLSIVNTKVELKNGNSSKENIGKQKKVP